MMKLQLQLQASMPPRQQLPIRRMRVKAKAVPEDLNDPAVRAAILKQYGYSGPPSYTPVPKKKNDNDDGVIVDIDEGAAANSTTTTTSRKSTTFSNNKKTTTSTPPPIPSSSVAAIPPPAMIAADVSSPDEEPFAEFFRTETGGGDDRILSLIAEHRAMAATLPPSLTTRYTTKAEQVTSLFPFALDKFQERAFKYLLKNESVVVCAPTGAGKTAIAEAASIATLAAGKRVIYTTPLKALSNQKLYELREKFGSDKIGLQTGDVSLNIQADITVMTTEVLRNIIYRAMEKPSTLTIIDHDGGGNKQQSQQSQQSEEEAILMEQVNAAKARLADVGLVVLDEVHYLGDPDRGSVWEEVIIHLSSHIQLLCMSATVANPDELGGWIRSMHGPCRNVTTTFRPVPLSWYYAQIVADTDELAPLLHDSGKSISRALMTPRSRPLPPLEIATSTTAATTTSNSKKEVVDEDWIARLETRAKSWDVKLESVLPREYRDALKKPSRSNGSGRRDEEDDMYTTSWSGGQRNNSARFSKSSSSSPPSKFKGNRAGRWSGWNEEDEAADDDYATGVRSGGIPTTQGLLQLLRQHDMLPAIWFIFSRNGCDTTCTNVKTSLTTLAEQAEIKAAIDALRASQPEVIREAFVPSLIQGVAAHHAGCLPGWKTLMERLFQRGLLKLVFATDTLAAGINMPARTTLISSLSRRRGERGNVSLTHNELMQMAGRAGRRGYDTLGNCIVLKGRFDSPMDAVDLVIKGPEALESQFAAGFGMVLSLLQSNTLEEARNTISKSFGTYVGGDGMEERLREVNELELRANQVESQLGGVRVVDQEALRDKVREVVARLAVEKEALGGIYEQAMEQRNSDIERILEEENSGGNGGVGVGWVEGVGGKLVAVMVLGRVDEVAMSVAPPRSALDILTLSSSAASSSKAKRNFDVDNESDEDEEENADEEEEEDDITIVSTPPVSPASLTLRDVLASLPPPSCHQDPYLCLSSDNEFYLAYPEHIVQTSLSSSSPVSVVSDAIRDRILNEYARFPWTPTSSSTAPLSAHSPHLLLRAPGTAETIPIALSLASSASASTEINHHPLHADMMSALDFQLALVRDLSLKHLDYKTQLDQTRPKTKTALRKLRRVSKLRERATKLKQALDETRGPQWRSFEDVVFILTQIGALTGDPLRPTPLGNMTRRLRSDNELWLALALRSLEVESLGPTQLAAFVSALLANNILGGRGSVTCKYKVSDTVLTALVAMEPERQRLLKIQLQRAGSLSERLFEAMTIDVRLAGLVEAWAAGATWEQIMKDSTLDDGDVARLLSRTADLLRQVVHIDELPNNVQRSARLALKGMYRSPISELLRG